MGKSLLAEALATTVVALTPTGVHAVAAIIHDLFLEVNCTELRTQSFSTPALNLLQSL
jgi:hypothetical protein